MPKTKPIQFNTTHPVIENFQSPVLLNTLAVPVNLDKELVRSIAIYGDFDSFRGLVRRFPNYFPDSSSKQAARQRRRYLNLVKRTDVQKFEAICAHYAIPFETQKDLSLEFDKVTTKMMNSYFSPAKKNGKTFKLISLSSLS